MMKTHTSQGCVAGLWLISRISVKQPGVVNVQAGHGVGLFMSI
jgi:hypothetical protein